MSIEYNSSLNPKWDPDVLAEVHLLSTEKGGRVSGVVSGYRPHHKIKEDYQTSGQHFYIDRNGIEPGESALAFIKLISPEVYPKSLTKNQILEIAEGSHIVGSVRVIDIFNKILERDVL